LVATEIQITPYTLSVVMLGALAIALRATARALPLQSDIDALELEVELRFR